MSGILATDDSTTKNSYITRFYPRKVARCVVPPASSWMPWPLLGFDARNSLLLIRTRYASWVLPTPPLPSPPLASPPSFRILLLPFPSADAPSRQADRQTDESRVGADGRGSGGAGVAAGEAARAPLVQQQPSDYRSWGSSTTMLCGESTHIYLLLNSRCLSVYPAVAFICRTTRRSRRW